MSHCRTLLLLAALFALLAALPAAAQGPTPPAPVTSHQHSIVLQHITPISLLKLLKWDDPAISNLPSGVDAISASPDNKTLLISATDAGFDQVSGIVHVLDTPLRQAQVKVSFAVVSVTDLDSLGINFDLLPVYAPPSPNERFLQCLSDGLANRLYQIFNRTHQVVQLSPIALVNNVRVTAPVKTQIPCITALMTAAPISPKPSVQYATLWGKVTLMPRINSDDSVTLEISPTLGGVISQKPQGTTPAPQQYGTLLRTVRSGDTLVLGGWRFSQAAAGSSNAPQLYVPPAPAGQSSGRVKQTDERELLMFLTLTIVSESKDSQPIKATP